MRRQRRRPHWRLILPRYQPQQPRYREHYQQFLPLRRRLSHQERRWRSVTCSSVRSSRLFPSSTYLSLSLFSQSLFLVFLCVCVMLSNPQSSNFPWFIYIINRIDRSWQRQHWRCPFSFRSRCNYKQHKNSILFYTFFSAIFVFFFVFLSFLFFYWPSPFFFFFTTKGYCFLFFTFRLGDWRKITSSRKLFRKRRRAPKRSTWYVAQTKFGALKNVCLFLFPWA